MDILARVLFHVDSLKAYGALGLAHIEINVTTLADGLIELRDLIALREIGVEVVLSGEAVESADLAVSREA
jgi:hypothetical protein